MTKNRPSVAPLMISANSVSEAYARALLHIVDHSGTEVSPLVLTVSGLENNDTISEDAGVRHAMDQVLEGRDETSVEDVAFTIFPQQLWKMAQGDRKKLYQFYDWSFPAFKAWNHQKNGRGLYFQRLTNFGRGPCDGNQLEWILNQTSRKGARRSLAQATTFDPEYDHTASALLGFPCLQHVTFMEAGDGLVVNAFYATQQIFNKAYGNYLGLAQLGAFMAHEMKVPFARLNITIGVAKLEKIGKTAVELSGLVKAARDCVAAAN
ncbi:thymidylate synthase [Sphingomonadales bacterium EhC05]|nr:thymidylate synthase [Sphingomonadales bacterium EhC05]